MKNRFTFLFVLLSLSACHPPGVCSIDTPYDCLEPGDDGGTVPDAGPPELQCPDEVTHMGQQIDFAGTWTAPNPVSKVPAGATDVALNVVSDRQGLAECAVGQGPINGDYFTSSEHLLSGTIFGNYSFEHTGLALYRRVLGNTPTVISGDMPATPSGRMRFVPAGDDLYILTATGPKVIDSGEGPPVVPGVLQPGDLPPYANYNSATAIPGTTIPVFLAYGNAVAYRIVVMRQDAEGRTILSAPSSRVVYANTNDSDQQVRNVGINIRLGPDVKAGDRIQVYRTSQAPIDVGPGDTMAQVAELLIYPGNITAGARDFADGTPDELRGAALYTNNGQQGIGMSNNRPPFATVAETYKQHLFLGNVTYAHQLDFRLIGLPDSTTVMTYTASPDPSGTDSGYSGTFAYNSSYPGTNNGGATSSGAYPAGATVSQKVEIWSRAFVFNVNLNSATSGISAQYVSGDNDPPGMIHFFWKSTSNVQLSVVASEHGERFVPELTVPLLSEQDRNQNELAISKESLPYAFPGDTSFHILLGRGDLPILGLMKNRDSLFAFKEDGIWRIFPGGNGFTVQQMSTDIALEFPDSLAVVDNQIMGFFSRGMMSISESGIEEVDAPIKDVIDAIRSINLPTARLQPGVFAVADPTRLRYYLWYPEVSGGGVSTHARVYNGRTDTWTERDDAATGGYTGKSGLIYLGLANAPRVTEQRHTGTASDFQGPSGQPIPVRIDWKGLTNQNPGGVSFYREVRVVTEKPTTGPYRFDFTNDYNFSEGTDARADGGKFVNAAVPDGMMRTSYLGVSMKRNVLNEYLVVLGLRDVSDNYDGPTGR